MIVSDSESMPLAVAAMLPLIWQTKSSTIPILAKVMTEIFAMF
jgi:hypothetical protein